MVQKNQDRHMGRHTLLLCPAKRHSDNRYVLLTMLGAKKVSLLIVKQGLSWHASQNICQRYINPFPIDNFNSLTHSPDLKRPCINSLLKTSWEKEKLLVTSIFSFSHNVFYHSTISKIKLNFQ